jgi:hypothetical protein
MAKYIQSSIFDFQPSTVDAVLLSRLGLDCFYAPNGIKYFVGKISYPNNTQLDIYVTPTIIAPCWDIYLMKPKSGGFEFQKLTRSGNLSEFWQEVILKTGDYAE